MSLGNLYLLFRACGATIVNRTDELQESDVGTGAGLFEIKKIGDEYVYKIHALVSYQPYCELFITRASCHSKKLTFLRKHFCIICAIPYSPLEFVCKTDHVVVKPQRDSPSVLFIRYFCFITECKNPKACTILLRGPSKDILQEV